MAMHQERLPADFYERIKSGLHRRIGRELRTARHVLDLGCGSCDLVRFLATSYSQDVIGIDVSHDSFPPRRHTSNGTSFRCLKRDAANLHVVEPGWADAVVSMWALHEMGPAERVLNEAQHALRSGGELLIVDFPRGSLAQQLWNEDYYTPEELRAMLGDAHFTDVSVRLVEREQVMWAKAHRPAESRLRKT